jgi:glutathione synthase/RimK-type ligase-like ATP-grasp enzyme
MLSGMRIALATCKVLPEPDGDEAPLLEALRRRGHEAAPLAWDDPQSDPGSFDLVVLRATWNYHLEPQRFLAWVDRTSRQARLVNPPAIVRWNLHKRYLLELQAAGVAVVPTTWIARGQPVSAREIQARTGWDDVVVKPAISAASYRTRRLSLQDADAFDEFVRSLCAERDVMVQPYLSSVEEHGERALVWIAGELTHAVHKHPRFGGSDERVATAPDPLPEERGLAAAALDRWRDQALYARVDVMRDDEGRLVVSELEMIEPSLFFLQSCAALERFADALGALAI